MRLGIQLQLQRQPQWSVRQRLRLAWWQRAASRRHDLGGITGGIDRVATLALIRAKGEHIVGVVVPVTTGFPEL